MNQKSPPRNPEAPVFNGHRGEFHSIVFQYVKDDLGIPIHLGSPDHEILRGTSLLPELYLTPAKGYQAM